MKTYDLHNNEGRLFAFEVDNAFLGRRGACRVIRSIPNVKILREPKFLSWFREEVFCEFELGGHTFEVWEPYGDNSRYWVGPEPVVLTEQITDIRAAFAAAGIFGRPYGG